MFAKDVEEGTVFEGPGGESGKVQVGNHSDVIEDWLVIDQPETFQVYAAQVSFPFADFISKGMLPLDDVGFYDDLCGEYVLAYRRGSTCEGENADPLGFSLDNAPFPLMSDNESLVYQHVKGLPRSGTGQ